MPVNCMVICTVPRHCTLTIWNIDTCCFEPSWGIIFLNILWHLIETKAHTSNSHLPSSSHQIVQPYLYVHSSSVFKNVDTKWNAAASPAGVLSGSSGRQKLTQLCISAMLKLPVSFSVLYGLKPTWNNISSHMEEPKSLAKEEQTLKHEIASHWWLLPSCSLCPVNHCGQLTKLDRKLSSATTLMQWLATKRWSVPSFFSQALCKNWLTPPRERQVQTYDLVHFPPAVVKMVSPLV